MVKLKRHELAAEAARRNREQLARLGGQARQARLRRRLTQAELADRVGLARSTISAIERGLGGSHTMDAWQRLAIALDLPLIIELGRDALEGPLDAGHLAIQELLLRLARDVGRGRSFELATRASDPRHSADTGLRDDRLRVLILAECWNTIGDLGSAARSTNRKVAELEDLGVAIGGDAPYRVALCWVVRATRRNRELVARYPEIFRSRFPGSSLAWVRALRTGSEPPAEPGLVWCDTHATRLFPWRRSSEQT